MELIYKYAEFAGMFLLEIQAKTIGQISPNLIICQNSTITIVNNSIEVWGMYEDL